MKRKVVLLSVLIDYLLLRFLNVGFELFTSLNISCIIWRQLIVDIVG